jgi:predicted DNA-binding protein (MmcQ/YjbR family)
MTREGFDAACRALPAVTMVVQWGESQVYKVGGRMFALLGSDDGCSLKCSEIAYMALTVAGTGRKMPYSSGGNWIAFPTLDTLPDEELTALLAQSHALIVAKLTRAARRDLGLA